MGNGFGEGGLEGSKLVWDAGEGFGRGRGLAVFNGAPPAIHVVLFDELDGVEDDAPIGQGVEAERPEGELAADVDAAVGVDVFDQAEQVFFRDDAFIHGW